MKQRSNPTFLTITIMQLALVQNLPCATAEKDLPAEATQHIARSTRGAGDVAIFQNDPALSASRSSPESLSLSLSLSAAPEDLSFRVQLQSEQKVEKVKQRMHPARASSGEVGSA